MGKDYCCFLGNSKQRAPLLNCSYALLRRNIFFVLGDPAARASNPRASRPGYARVRVRSRPDLYRPKPSCQVRTAGYFQRLSYPYPKGFG